MIRWSVVENIARVRVITSVEIAVVCSSSGLSATDEEEKGKTGIYCRGVFLFGR